MKTFLALGDSYTIGEGVLLKDSFPYQTVQLLRLQNIEVAAPEIIAKTGWTTKNLIEGICSTKLLPKYDFVSLLIGVNNQYDGVSFEDFEKEFEVLIEKSIAFTNNNSNHVFVFSIPDWGATPFAVDRDRVSITSEIKKYNNYCKLISEKYNCVFIEITESYILDAVKEEFLAADKLHPSGKEYGKWAEELNKEIILLHFA